MQNKILIGIICLLVAVMFVNSAFKNGKSSGGKEYVTITVIPMQKLIHISSSSGEYKFVRLEKASQDYSAGLKIASEYQLKGFNVIGSTFSTSSTYELGIFMEKE